MAEDRPRGLGRGLSALIGDEAAAPAHGAVPAKGSRTLPVAFLRPNPHQPRKTFHEEELRDLAGSIREKGVLQPILVRPIAGQADAFEIVAGERRWRAAQMAKLHDVPVVVREISNSEALELAIIENVQREDLNAIEEAAAYHELADRFGYTQERLAQEIGKSRSHIANTLRLLRLPEGVKVMIREGKLTAGHARTLIGLADPEARAREIVAGALNVREAEQRSQDNKKPKKPHHKDADTRALEANLANALGLKVEIAHKANGSGEVKIAYKTLEQLDEVCRRLSNPKGI
ncbi:MAG TPA: ParB/RepB/Spo0J family partition protein [Rhizomicrobium sp.]|jgi:ParB family chromosome partitioning protein|nr:ParB/RepB/Spo0J family partition protein [Rhizomicrobium sp.]